MRNGTRRLARPRDRRYQVGGSCRVRPGRKDPATCRCTHTRRYEPLARGAAQASKEHSRLLRWAPSPCPRRPCTPARRRRCRPDQRNAGQAACRNRRRRPHDPRTALFPTVGHFASWAGACPGPQGISRSPPLRANPCRAAVAHRPAQRMRTRRRAHQRHLPRRTLRPATRPARRTNGDRGRAATSCSSRASASSATTSPYRDLGPDWQRSATRSRSTAPDACSASSKRSATPSARSSRPTRNRTSRLTSSTTAPVSPSTPRQAIIYGQNVLASRGFTGQPPWKGEAPYDASRAVGGRASRSCRRLRYRHDRIVVPVRTCRRGWASRS